MTAALQKVQSAYPIRRSSSAGADEGATLVDRFNASTGKELEGELSPPKASAIFSEIKAASGHGDCGWSHAACRGVSV
jgi:hypothetical protein